MSLPDSLQPPVAPLAGRRALFLNLKGGETLARRLGITQLWLLLLCPPLP